MTKKIFSLFILFLGLFLFTACSNELDSYKQESKELLEKHALDNKDELADWEFVNKYVNDALEDIDNANSIDEIDTIVDFVKAKIDNFKNKTAIPFVLSSKTTNFFDKTRDEKLLKLVKSYQELANLLSEEEFTISPAYDEAFFETKDLLIYCFTNNIYNNLEIILLLNDDTLEVHQYVYNKSEANEADRNWTFIIELNKTTNIKEIDIK